jgi:hypothetical protein
VRIGRRIPVMLAGAIAITLIGGVAAAVTASPTTAKACVTSGGALRLSVGGKCASGQTAITLGQRGPKGSAGKTGKTGARGPQGDPGTPGSDGGATRINLSQFVIDTGATPPTHYLGTAGPVSLVATCAGTTAAPSLTLTLSAATESLTYTATDVKSNDGATPTVALYHGSAISLASASLPADVADGTPDDTMSDVITIVVGAQDGTQVTSTVDVEVNATPGDTACSVNGTIAAA